MPTRVLAAPPTLITPDPAAPTPAPLPAGAFPPVPGYEILGELGRGGMGVVFKARQAGLNRLVALKMLHTGRAADAAAVERFRVEAEAVARFQHPQIVQIYEIGETGGQPYLALEYVPGTTLAHVLAAGPLPPDRAAAVIEAAAQAVHYAHQRGVLHRDIKPANILLVSGEWSAASPPLTTHHSPLHLKITDFGLAKQLEEVTWPTYHGVVGTPGYMAPEQAEGRRDLTAATDVYALGAVLYECLTGRPPFQGADPLSTLRQVAEDDAAPPRSLRPDVPAPLEAVCLKCLHNHPPPTNPTPPHHPPH
ncbi:MAG TPA: serine/threonine-protein kinase, partial [Gemmataceae bacterium]